MNISIQMDFPSWWGILPRGFDIAEFKKGIIAPELVYRADGAMYKAKKLGGNKVCVTGYLN